MNDARQQDLVALTVELLSAFVANNNVRAEDIAGLVTTTHQALAGLTSIAVEPAEPAAEEHVPAVTVRKSLADRDVIISLIDGKPYKSLKRHLTSRGLTPDDYRARYNLPASYPMVAPGYSEERRAVAKRLGLGRKRTPAEAEPEAEPEAAVQADAQAEAPPPKRKYTRRIKADAAPTS